MAEKFHFCPSLGLRLSSGPCASPSRQHAASRRASLSGKDTMCLRRARQPHLLASEPGSPQWARLTNHFGSRTKVKGTISWCSRDPFRYLRLLPGPSFLGRHLLLKWKLRNVNIPLGLIQEFSHKVSYLRRSLGSLHVSAVNEKGVLASIDGETYILTQLLWSPEAHYAGANTRTPDPTIGSYCKSIKACV